MKKFLLTAFAVCFAFPCMADDTGLIHGTIGTVYSGDSFSIGKTTIHLSGIKGLNPDFLKTLINGPSVVCISYSRNPDDFNEITAECLYGAKIDLGEASILAGSATSDSPSYADAMLAAKKLTSSK